jgi:hypothetical protein
LSDSDPIKHTGRLTRPAGALPFPDNGERKRTNKKLEQWILSYLGLERERNPYTNSLTSISHLQISSMAPDYILKSSDDILNTLYNMRDNGLVEEVESSYSEFPQFRIAPDGIIKFRKQLRPIAELAINHADQYQIVLDAIDGDSQVKEELKKVPEKIKDSIEKDSKIKAELKKIPKQFADRLKNRLPDKAIEVFLDSALKYGGPAVAVYIAKLVGG